MEYSINFIDVFSLAKKKKKIVIVFALICALAFSGYYYISNKTADKSTSEKEAQIAIEKYQKWAECNEGVRESTTDEIISAYETLNYNPVMTLDATNVSKRRVVLTFFNDKEVYLEKTINGWINGIDCKTLFGKESELLNQYRNDLINVFGSAGEVCIDIYDIKEYNIDSVAKQVLEVVKNKASKIGITISASQNYKFKGFDQSVYDKQDVIRNDVTKLLNENNMISAYSMQAPADKKEINGASTSKSIIFAIVGFLFGLFIALAVLLIRVVLKGTILSCKQINSTFSIEKLGTASTKDKTDIPLINAVVRAMIKTKEKIMLVSIKDNETYKTITKCLDEVDDNSYSYSVTALDSVELIDELKAVDDIIIPVSLGKTTGKEIYTVINWANKFGKNILGYIVIDE